MKKTVILCDFCEKDITGEDINTYSSPDRDHICSTCYDAYIQGWHMGEDSTAKGLSVYDKNKDSIMGMMRLLIRFDSDTELSYVLDYEIDGKKIRESIRELINE